MDVLNAKYINHQVTPTNPVQAKTSSTDGKEFAQMIASAQAAFEPQSKHAVKPTVVFNMNTNQGNVDVDLDKYMSNKPLTTDRASLTDTVLLLPTAQNVENLSKYSEAKFKELLAEYDIPAPPKTIEFDGEGNMVLPADYPHKEQLKQAFAENPAVEKALRTTTALASHYAGIMEAQPFRDEMATARNKADRDRIIDKYSYLFDDNRPAKHIVLTFLEDGKMLVGEKAPTATP